MGISDHIRMSSHSYERPGISNTHRNNGQGLKSGLSQRVDYRTQNRLATLLKPGGEESNSPFQPAGSSPQEIGSPVSFDALSFEMASSDFGGHSKRKYRDRVEAVNDNPCPRKEKNNL